VVLMYTGDDPRGLKTFGMLNTKDEDALPEV
jgi:hypothetical protein